MENLFRVQSIDSYRMILESAVEYVVDVLKDSRTTGCPKNKLYVVQGVSK